MYLIKRFSIVFSIFIFIISGAAFGEEYKFVPMDGVNNVSRRDVCDRAVLTGLYAVHLGFTEWFKDTQVTLKGIPFKLSTKSWDTLSGASGDSQSFEIPVPKGKIYYILGIGDRLTADAGHKLDYCDNIEHFNMEAVYKDGSTEEIFPVNIISNLPRWYDFTNKDVSVASFNMEEDMPMCGRVKAVGNLSIYAVIPSKPDMIEKLYFNDNSDTGDYGIFAITVADSIPSELTKFLKEGARKFHPAPEKLPTSPGRMQNDGNFILYDMSSFCNQSIDKCFDYGYGVGRGQVTGLNTKFTESKVTYDGIPFMVSTGEKNVVSGSWKGLESYSIPINRKASKIYTLMGLAFDRPTYEGTKLNYNNNPNLFNIEVVYSNGTREKIFPREYISGEFKFYSSSPDKEFRTYLIEPTQDKIIKEIIFNDRMDAGDFVLAGITLSTEAASFKLPTIPIAVYKKEPIGSKPTVTKTGNTVQLENTYMKVVLSVEDGLKLDELVNKYVSDTLISGLDKVNLFEIYDGKTDKKRYLNTDFNVTNVKIDNNKTNVLFELQSKDGAGFTVSVQFALDSSPELKFDCNVLNTSNTEKEFIIHTYLTNIRIGDIENMHYFYPPPKGTIDNKAFKIRKTYGGAAYMQLMDIYNPLFGAGIYIRSDDSWGQVKVLSLWKYGGNNNSQAADSGTKNWIKAWNAPENTVVDDTYLGGINDHNPPLQVKLDSGCYMGFEYWYRVVKPGEKSEVPSMVIGMHTGDWHVAFERYSKWVKANSFETDYPEWLKKSFSVGGCHTPGMHDSTKYYLNVDTGLDILEPAMWWNDPGKPESGGTKEYYYRSDFGGKDAFKAAVEDAKKRGVNVVLYIEGFGFPAQFTRGEDADKLYATSCIMSRDGGLSLGAMCPGAPEWQDYVALTCARLVKDLGVKGVYLDSIGQIPPMMCFNPAHHHKYPGLTWVHDVKELYHKVRAAMKAVDPDAVLYSEAPCADIATAELDGAWNYYFNFKWVTPERYENPILTGMECFLFRNKKMWSLPEGTLDAATNTGIQAFFNASCISIEPSVGMSPSALSPYRKYMNPELVKLRTILRDNYKIYTSPDAYPYVQSYIDKVFVNRFGSGKEVIYNLLNYNYVPVDGKLFEVEEPCEYKDLITGKRAEIINENNRYFIRFALDPRGIAALKRIK